jgi:hypothetical protein
VLCRMPEHRWVVGGPMTTDGVRIVINGAVPDVDEAEVISLPFGYDLWCATPGTVFSAAGDDPAGLDRGRRPRG